ncbi:alpha/beta hydrolase [candidate division KSB1 bacterium]|nr:alpha/beta hydrolase [candidate division KSB1 bacterium]
MLRQAFFLKANTWRYVRLAYALLVFALSLLAIFEAPTRLLWMAAILVTEYGHFLVILPLAVLLPGWRHSWPGRFSVVLALIASLLTLTPIFRALQVKNRLPEQFELAFDSKNDNSSVVEIGRQNPLDFSDLWFGIEFSTIESSTHVYGRTDGKELTLDLYRATSGNPAPGVIVIHGGAWRSGDSKELPDLNSYLAGRGYVVAAVTYRLAPQSRYPAPISDIQAAISFLREHASEFGLDPSRLVLLGRSAGAHLALQTAYTSDEPAIRGVVSLYGPADLYYGYTHPARPLVIDTKKVIAEFLGGNPTELPEIYRTASPIHYVGANTPPTLLIHGGRDELVSPEQSRRLASRLRASEVPNLYLQLPWATHACDFNLSGPSGQLILYAIEHFLDWCN